MLCEIIIDKDMKYKVIDSKYHSGFGISEDNKCLKLYAIKKLPFKSITRFVI